MSVLEVKFDGNPLESTKALQILARSWNFWSQLNDFKKIIKGVLIAKKQLNNIINSSDYS